MSHYKIESWQQRKAGIRVRLRIPKFIFSHRYIGTCDAEYFGARGITFHYKRSTETAFSSPVVADNTLRSHENKDRAVDDLRLASCRSPFDVFCARVTARAARSGWSHTHVIALRFTSVCTKNVSSTLQWLSLKLDDEPCILYENVP
eukprot:m.652622 g.652622  ORF g.652622 m.652622 type:complete len:147 (+) comp22691_c2_seq6:3574-4014(+)